MIQKLLSRDQLKALKRSIERAKQLREGAQTVRITVHMGSCGIASGAEKLMDLLLEERTKCSRSDISVVRSGCIGLCSEEPLITVEELGQEPVIYRRLDSQKLGRIFRRHLLNGKVQNDLALARGRVTDEEARSGSRGSGNEIPPISRIPFFSFQKSLVLRNRGWIDPERIEDYIWRDGYQAMAKAFVQMTPPEIISEVKTSGLRDRGWKGFPIGIKWGLYTSFKEDVRVVLCHADELPPGPFSERNLLETDPHIVLEGMIITARAIGSHRGYIWLPAEHTLAATRLNRAIEQAREYGLLGDNILGSRFDFDIEIYPPYSSILPGLRESQIIRDNVETYANIPPIILHGGEKYAATGTASSKGTKIFALAGKLNLTGWVEVPMGTTIGQMIFDMGGGLPSGKRFKAVQFGGPFGGCLPGQYLNIPMDYEAISRAGAVMGSGGLTVMGQETCMVDRARSFLHFCQNESCQKFVFCHAKTERINEVFQRICSGEGRQGDIERLEELAHQVKEIAACDLGRTAPHSILSTIRHFREEYRAHIDERRCPAAVCSALFKSPCQHTCPVGVDIPGAIGLIRAGRNDDAYKLIKQTNPFPSICGRICSHPCQEKCRRVQVDEPIAIRNLERFVSDRAKRAMVDPLPVTRKEKMTIVGAGPSGLAAALELKRRGYAVTLFEELPEAGGILRWGIPSFRLPREVLDREIQDIIDTGVELRTRVCIGRDIQFEDLEKDFDLIYVAVGAQKNVSLRIPGEESSGVFGGVGFLRKYHLGEKIEIGRHVAVIGAGMLAIDVARTVIRMGAKKVSIYYERERKDMPALEDEIRGAEEEGVEIKCLVSPVRIVTQYGRATRIELTEMRLDKFDPMGRRQPKPILGSEFREKAETIISAIGREPDLGFLPKGIGIERDGSFIKIDSNFRTVHARIWAGGDVIGCSRVINAIQAGQRAGRAMDESVRLANGEKPWMAPGEERVIVPFEVDTEIKEQCQTRMREISPEVRRSGFREVRRGYTSKMALREVCRCIRCDASQVGENGRKHGQER